MDNLIWTLILTGVGVLTFELAGRKVWWAWYVGIAAQLLWVGYAVFTNQYGFLLSVLFYGSVYVRNAVKWTKDRTPEEQTPLNTEMFREMVDYAEKDVEQTLHLYNNKEIHRMKQILTRYERENNRLRHELNKERRRRELLS